MKSKIYKGNLFTMSLLILNLTFSLMAAFLNKYFKLNNYTYMFIGNLVFLALPLTIYFIVNKESPKEVLRIKSLSLKDIMLIILISIFVQPLMNFLSGIMALIFPNDVGTLLSNSNTVPMWIKLFVIAFMPAVLEELSMRGVVLSNYKHLGVKKSAILTGLLFGLLHMNIQMLLYTFTMGILFAYFVHITDSIFSSMLSHFIINGTQTILSAKFTEKVVKSKESLSSVNASMNMNTSGKVAFIVVGSIVAILSIIIVKSFMKKLAKNHGMDLKNMDQNIYMKDTYDTHDLENINNECITSQAEISSAKESKEKILNLPFIIIILVYVVFNGIKIYNLFK